MWTAQSYKLMDFFDESVQTWWVAKIEKKPAASFWRYSTRQLYPGQRDM